MRAMTTPDRTAQGPKPAVTYWCSDHRTAVAYGDPDHAGCMVRARHARAESGPAQALTSRGGAPRSKRRILTGYAHLDYVLGGDEPGFFEREVLLLTGEPGCGKSTLVLLLALGFAQRGARVLYATGEESFDDVRARAGKLGRMHPKVRVVATQSWEVVRSVADQYKPHLVIVDSVQRLATMHAKGRAGSHAQVEAIGGAAVALAKRSTFGPLVLCIGHIIKDGSAAGPLGLVHDVDAHLHISLDSATQYRVLKSKKNRGGPTDAVSAWRFDGPRLVEVKSWRADIVKAALVGFGSVAFAAKPLTGQSYAVPVEAFVSSPRDAGTPVRRATGFSESRLRDIVDGLEEHAGVPLADRDVRVAVPEFGNDRVDDAGLDLAVAAAIVSSCKRLKLPPACVMGAITITGRVTPVSDVGARVGAARECGVRCVVTPAWPASVEAANTDVSFEPVVDIDGLVRWVQSVGEFVPMSAAQAEAAEARKAAADLRKEMAESRKAGKARKGAQDPAPVAMD